MTRIIAVVALALLILTGCGGNDPANPSTESSGTYRIVDVNAKGRSVTCISWKNGYAGGLSCDWAGAR